jgi:branched-chain amino acid transport system ATP-binding protein
MNVLLETRGLTRSFDSVVAAGNISLCFARDQTVAVIGTNGAGKTTFVNMVTGFVKPTSGEILFEGAALTGLSPREVMRSGVCRSFQIAQLFPSMTVREQLMLATALRATNWRSLVKKLDTRARDKEIGPLLEAFDIDRYRDHVASALPQGARKLVDIAMALAGRPRLLFLDEPTSGVSAEEKLPLMERIMKGLRAQNVTTIIIEHDMDIVAACASRVIAFHQGCVLADGNPTDVLENADVRELIVG